MANYVEYIKVGAAGEELPVRDAEALHQTGGTMRGNIDMGGNKVTGLGAPEEEGDVVTKGSLLNLIFPINSIYISYSHTSPAELFGGTWTRIENRFLRGIAESAVIGETGGEETHTLTTAEMPKHSHNPLVDTVRLGANNGDSSGWQVAAHSNWSQVGTYITTSSVGSGKAHNNMPPYINVSIWRRTA